MSLDGLSGEGGLSPAKAVNTTDTLPTVASKPTFGVQKLRLRGAAAEPLKDKPWSLEFGSIRLVESIIDFGTAEENHVDGVSGIYRISQNTIVMRHTWDRAC